MDFVRMNMFPEIGLKVLMALICGGLIGIEREMKAKPAGLKTNLLICVGACLYTVMGELLISSSTQGGPMDPGRIPAQIVSGIGFLGAGTIIQSRGSVHGLTSAAIIWVVAAIGICIGAGYLLPAFLFTATVIFTLFVVDYVEKSFVLSCQQVLIECALAKKNVKQSVFKVFHDHHIDVTQLEIEEDSKLMKLHADIWNTKKGHRLINSKLLTIPGVINVNFKKIDKK